MVYKPSNPGRAGSKRNTGNGQTCNPDLNDRNVPRWNRLALDRSYDFIWEKLHGRSLIPDDFETGKWRLLINRRAGNMPPRQNQTSEWKKE